MNVEDKLWNINRVKMKDKQELDLRNENVNNINFTFRVRSKRLQPKPVDNRYEPTNKGKL